MCTRFFYWKDKKKLKSYKTLKTNFSACASPFCTVWAYYLLYICSFSVSMFPHSSHSPRLPVLFHALLCYTTLNWTFPMVLLWVPVSLRMCVPGHWFTWVGVPDGRASHSMRFCTFCFSMETLTCCWGYEHTVETGRPHVQRWHCTVLKRTDSRNAKAMLPIIQHSCIVVAWETHGGKTAKWPCTFPVVNI